MNIHVNTHENPACDRAELLRDYAFEELSPDDRRAMQQHLTECQACASDLDQMRLTTAVLRVLPDVEVPRRIAFVSDQAPATNWFATFWNSAARLGFASACVLAIGLVFAATHRPPEAHTVIQASAVPQAELDAAVNKAVALAVDKAHDEDMRLTKAALDAVDTKYAQKQRNLMISMQETLDFDRKSRDRDRIYAMSYDTPRIGAGQ